MTRLLISLGAACALVGSLAALPAAAADFTFQFMNDSDRALSLKLFSRAATHREWPSKTKSYSVRPGAAVQELKVDCDEGEQICWGAWVAVQNVTGQVGASGQRDVRTTKWVAGAGERGMRACTNCCYVCKDGAKSPIARLDDPDAGAR